MDRLSQRPSTRKLNPGHVLCVFLFLFSINTHADVPASQQAEVEHLLSFVKNSGCTLDRNGTTHQGAEAVNHIQIKYDYFRDDIKTTEDFIELSATKSTMSGRYYQVDCPGQDKVRTKDWLLGELKAFRANHTNAQKD